MTDIDDGRVTNPADIPPAHGYVIATDTFMSGWGRARGLTNVLIVACDDDDEIAAVRHVLTRRSEMTGVRRVDRFDHIPDTWYAQAKAGAVVRTWRTDTKVGAPPRRHDGGVRPSDVLDALRFLP